MTESVIHPEPFSKNFCIFAIILVQIDLNTFLMSLSLIIISAFELELKLSHFVFSLLYIFLKTKTNVVRNLKPL